MEKEIKTEAVDQARLLYLPQTYMRYLLENLSSYTPCNFDSGRTAQEFIPLTSSLCNPYTHQSWELLTETDM